MIFVVKVQLKKLSDWILNCFLITKKGFLLTISFKELDIKGRFPFRFCRYPSAGTLNLMPNKERNIGFCLY